MDEIKDLLNTDDITKLFGLNSSIYAKVIEDLKQKRFSLKKDYDKTFNNWVSTFKEIYGKEVSVNSDLFLKHTYFALILKVILIIKLGLVNNQDFDSIYEDFTSNNLSEMNLSEFNRFFYWVDLNKDEFNIIFEMLELTNFAFQDLFIDIYQQIFCTIHFNRNFYFIFKIFLKNFSTLYIFYENFIKNLLDIERSN